MNKIISIIFLSLSTISLAQLAGKKTNSKEIESAVNLLSQNLQSNPENPLNIDANFLTHLSNLIDNQSTKNVLESYSTNLGVDKDLSYRQVYWDLTTALKQSPTFANNTKYLKVEQDLSLIFDNYNTLADKLKVSGGKYEFGSFVNDPNLISSLNNITGSYENAQATALGLDLLYGVFNALEASKKFKEDYQKMAKLSTDVVYLETDPNLSKALIDACVGIELHQMITSLYRYDFNNGATLRVENGILKFIHSEKKISKDLAVIEKRHDGNYYNRETKALDAGAHAFPNAISISPNDSLLYLYTGANAFQDKKSNNCLDKKTGYLINTLSGDVIAARSDVRVPHIDKVKKMSFSRDTLVVLDLTFKEQWFNEKGKLKPNYSTGGSYILDDTKNFLINSESVKFKNGLRYSNDKSRYCFKKGNFEINLFWGGASYNTSGLVNNVSKDYPSSMIQISYWQFAKTKFFNSDAMVNELTGITMDKNKNFFFVGKNGKIGRLLADDFTLNDQTLQNKMREKMTNKIAETYDFNSEKKFLSNHGELANSSSSIYPTFTFTPDEKWLIYIVNEHLYIINPNDFTDVKSYELSFEPYNCFFGKENGDYTIYIQGQNDFKFPITKKYSIGKLSTMEIKKINLIKSNAGTTNGSDNTTKNSQPTSNDSNFSLADEIKKLKELFDAGAITQEEFTAAKSQLLKSTNNTASNKANTTSTNQSSSTAKPAKDVMQFEIKGKSYCAVNAAKSGLDIYGLYKYLGKEIRTYASQEGTQPIVQLDKTDKADNDKVKGKSGLWQAHGERSKAITWWLLSDCNGNLDLTKSENFNRYNIVVRYDEEDEIGHSNYPKGGFDFMSLSIYTDGSNKVLILGERVKQK